MILFPRFHLKASSKHIPSIPGLSAFPKTVDVVHRLLFRLFNPKEELSLQSQLKQCPLFLGSACRNCILFNCRPIYVQGSSEVLSLCFGGRGKAIWTHAQTTNFLKCCRSEKP